MTDLLLRGGSIARLTSDETIEGAEDVDCQGLLLGP